MNPNRPLIAPPFDPRRFRPPPDDQRSADQNTPPRLPGTTGWLVADFAPAFSWASLPAQWTGWTQWNQTPKGVIAYERLYDIGIVTLFVPLVTVSGDGSAVIEESHSTDNITFTPYAIAGPQVTARYIKIRVTMTGPYPKLKSMRAIMSANPVTEIIQDLNTASLGGAYRLAVGDIRLPITKTYTLIKKVDITLQSVGAGWSVESIDKDKTVGPRIKIYNASNALADAVIDATVTGL